MLTPNDETVSILGSNISVLDMDETCGKMEDLIAQWRRMQVGQESHVMRAQYICVSNVHTVVTGWQEPQYCAVTNGAVIATADGMPLLWVSRILSYVSSRKAIRGRVSGPDLLARCLENPGLKHFFVGSTPDVLQELQQSLKVNWPQAQLVGFYSPPFERSPNAKDIKHKAMIEQIRAANPDILWVGLGAPKQEIWMKDFSEVIPVPLMVGVGAAFDFLSGNKRRAPLWMQKMGLEWLFRLLSEPRRLFKRYAVTNSLFIWASLWQILRAMVKRD